jgi:hypothetical protein
MIQSSKERDNAYLYQQIVGRKILERESEIRRISWYKEREQNYEGEDPGCYKEWCFSGNPKTFNTLVQPIQTGTQSKWGHEINSRHAQGISLPQTPFHNSMKFFESLFSSLLMIL